MTIRAYVASAPIGVLEVRGKDRVDLLHRLCTNDLRGLGQGKADAVSTLFTTNQGKLLDWTLIVSRPDHLLVRTSHGRAQALAAWIDKYTIMEDVTTRDVSAAWSLVVLQGPGAADLAGLETLPAAGALVERHGVLWLRGLSAYDERLEGLTPSPQAQDLMSSAMAKGARLATESDLELWRLRAGVPSPLCEYKEEVNPLELRLGPHAVSWNKGCYIGQEVISRLDSYDKVARLLVGFEAEQGVPWEEGLKLTREGRPLGRVTSLATEGDRTVGLAVVKRESADSAEAELVTGGDTVAVRLVQRPFWDLA